MSKKQINSFLKDLRKLQEKHGVRIGFMTVDDDGRQLCSCCGIEGNDPLMKKHLELLYTALDQTVPEDAR